MQRAGELDDERHVKYILQPPDTTGSATLMR